MSSIKISAFSVWRSTNSFGGVPFDLGEAPVYYLFGVLADLFQMDYVFSERIIHLWPIALLTPFSSYILLKSLFKNSSAIIIGTFVYSFNTYFLVLQTGHLTLMSAYAIVPLVLFFYSRTLEKMKISWAVGTGLLYSLCFMYEPRAGYIVFWILGLNFLLHIIFRDAGANKKSLLKIFFFGILPFFVVGAINFYWIFTLMNVGVVTSNALFQRTLYANELMNILYSFTIYHPFWTGSNASIFKLQDIIVYFWLYPIFAFFGLLVNKKNTKVFFYGIVALLGVFLSKQADVPMPDVYQWLYDHLPGFNAFREASKFYFLVALGYSVLIASFFNWVWEIWRPTGWRRRIAQLITVIMIGILLLNTKPLITGEIGTLFLGREVPRDFLIVKDYLIKQEGFSRSLWIPTISRWSINTLDHPQVSMISQLNSDWDIFLRKISARNTDEDNIVNLIHSEEFEKILKTGSIRYVIVSRRGVGNEEDWIGNEDNRLVYIKALDTLNYLQRLELGTREIVVYENAGYKPHIYRTATKESIEKSIKPEKVDFRFISPTEYTLTVKSTSTPYYLNFTERFHSDWQLRVGELNVLDSISKENYFIKPSVHFENEALLNSYYINPVEICRTHKGCKLHADGSYEIPLTLYFKSQSYLVLGMIFSGIALLLSIFCIIYYGFKKTKHS